MTHNPPEEVHWVSCLRENFTSSSDGEGLETGLAKVPRQPFTLQVRFRDIKSTLGMDMLRTKSPDMIEKELLMHQIVYNLIRLLMLKAGMIHQVNHRRLSFRGTQQVILALRDNFTNLAARPKLYASQRLNMWERIAERFVIERPGRNEPRRAKRRPKWSLWLQKPRHEYFQHFRCPNPIAKILDQAA